MFTRTRRAHGIGFASTRLAVCQYGDIVALHERIDAVADVFPDSILIFAIGEYTIEDEEFLALRRLDGKGCRVAYLAGGGLESSGDEVVSGIGGVWRRPDAHSC